MCLRPWVLYGAPSCLPPFIASFSLVYRSDFLRFIIWFVFVHTHLTKCSRVANRTDAFEFADLIHTFATISAWWYSTFVNVGFAIASCNRKSKSKEEKLDLIWCVKIVFKCRLCGWMSFGYFILFSALIPSKLIKIPNQIIKIKQTCESGRTCTVIIIHQINASCTVLALVQTVVNVFGTSWTTPAFQAGTWKGSRRILTWCSIYARSQMWRWIRLTFVYI